MICIAEMQCPSALVNERIHRAEHVAYFMGIIPAVHESLQFWGLLEVGHECFALASKLRSYLQVSMLLSIGLSQSFRRHGTVITFFSQLSMLVSIWREGGTNDMRRI